MPIPHVFANPPHFGECSWKIMYSSKHFQLQKYVGLRSKCKGIWGLINEEKLENAMCYTWASDN